MQYDLKNDVLVERENHVGEWKPVPVHRLQEAIDSVKTAHQNMHAVNHQGSLSVKVKRGV